jgi:hypothetical protein
MEVSLVLFKLNVQSKIQSNSSRSSGLASPCSCNTQDSYRLSDRMNGFKLLNSERLLYDRDSNGILSCQPGWGSPRVDRATQDAPFGSSE